jgi:hypothetical protein
LTKTIYQYPNKVKTEIIPMKWKVDIQQELRVVVQNEIRELVTTKNQENSVKQDEEQGGKIEGNYKKSLRPKKRL